MMRSNHRNGIALVTALALAVAPVHGHSQQQGRSTAASPPPPFASHLDTLVESLRKDVGARGVAVALIENGKVTTVRTYGYADLERRIPVTPQTTFNAASVTKAATAWGIMKLVDEGKVKLDDPVFSHIKRWKLPPSKWPDSGVTIARLLSHTAGINRPTTGIWWQGDTLPTLEAVLSGASNGYGDTQLEFEPGKSVHYSGGGYSILQLLIEEVSGMPLDRYMKSKVLTPLGMTESAYGWPTNIMQHYAASYSELGFQTVAYRTAEPATGALNLTIGDLAKFAIAHVEPNAGRGVLRPATIAQMIAPAPATSNTRGLGVALERTPDGRVLVGHDGGNPGFGATFRIDPKTGNGIAILVNRSWGYELYYPLLCEWRNATSTTQQRETCNRSGVASITRVIVDEGLAAGRKRYEELRQLRPASLQHQQMNTIARRFLLNGREADAVEVLRWNLAQDTTSSRAHELLSDMLERTGSRSAAVQHLQAAVRFDPSNAALAEKLRKLSVQAR